jgi:hypothetical protein
MDPLFVGCTTKIKVLVKKGSSARDISTFTEKKFFITKPSGTLTTVDAAFSNGTGTDGYLEYQPNNTFFDQQGPWVLQVRLKVGATVQMCRPITFHVAPNIHASVAV